MHFWRYVGHLMGVRPRVHPETIPEALQVLFVAAIRGANTAGEDGVHLCQSFAQAFDVPPDARLGDRLEAGIHRGFTRFFLPGPIYRANGMPPVGLWVLVPLLMAPGIFLTETLRRHLPAVDALQDRVQRRRRDAWLARHLPGRKAEYAPVEKLREAPAAAHP